MATLDPESAGEQFLGLLTRACRRIDDRWFLLPVDNVDVARAYRERVYCYELYHQLRSLTERGTLAGAPDYVVSGEIDKAGLNAVIRGGRHKPDLVWHVPGQAMNAAVVEVKTTERWDDAGVTKDLETLTTFLSAGDRSYSRAAFLLFGPGDESDLRRKVGSLASPDDTVALRCAHLIWHQHPGSPAIDLGPIT